MIVTGIINWRDPDKPQTRFKCTRKEFVDFIDSCNADYVGSLMVDVCLTRWFFDGADWYSAPRYKYVPGKALVKLKEHEQVAKLRKSSRGFTQNGILN